MCFRKKGPITAVAMRREWGAAGRDVAQVREGAETARGESERRGHLVEEMWVRLEIEKGGEKAAEHLAEETRVCPRGEWGCGEWRGRCAEETRVLPERGVGQ